MRLKGMPEKCPGWCSSLWCQIHDRHGGTEMEKTALAAPDIHVLGAVLGPLTTPSPGTSLTGSCCHKQPLRQTIHQINMGLNRPISVQVTSLPHVPGRDWQLRFEAINHLGLARIRAQSSRTQRMHLILSCCCGEQTESARCIRQLSVLMYYL